MTNLVKFTPFGEMDRLFADDFFMPLAGRVPSQAVDLYETDNEVVAEIVIPGIDPKNVNVEIENNILHIRGEGEQVLEDKSRDYYRKEVRRDAFARSLALPVEVDADKVSASAERGVLKVVMPKTEQAKPRRIAIDVKE